MPRAIPPFDLVARALAALGHGRAAIELLEIVVGRGGEESARGGPLLATLRARADAPLGAPGVRVDAELVEAIATHGRLREALVVARALDSGGTVLGLEILHALEVVLSPPPDGEPVDMLLCFREGVDHGSAIAAQRVVLSPTASAELRRRAQMLVQLLRGFRALAGPTEPSQVLTVDPAVAALVGEMLTRRDLPWGDRALEPLRHLAGGAELHDAVRLLVSSTNGVVYEEMVGGPSTTPVEGVGVALLHIRMVNLEPAERTLRRLCIEQPEDRLAPPLLAAVGRLRAVQDASLDEPRTSEPGPRGAAPEWLNKRARRASVEGWAASAKRGVTPLLQEEVATSVLRPDDEAELQLRAGRPDKAVELYRRLAERFPDRPRFAQRAAEIDAQMQAKALMFADEMTVRRDLRPLAVAATDPAPPPVMLAPSPDALRPPSAPDPEIREPVEHRTVEMAIQFAGDSYAGDSYAGDSYSGDSYSGDSYSGDSLLDEPSIEEPVVRDTSIPPPPDVTVVVQVRPIIGVE